MDEKPQRKAKKVMRAESAKGYGVSDTNWANHHQLFAHLIAAGPTMHGTPRERPKKTH